MSVHCRSNPVEFPYVVERSPLGTGKSPVVGLRDGESVLSVQTVFMYLRYTFQMSNRLHFFFLINKFSRTNLFPRQP